MAGIAAVIAVALCVGVRAEGAEPTFDAFVPPLRAEAGPILSPAIDPIPRDGIFASAGVRYAKAKAGLVGLNDDAHHPYGDFTVSLGVAWRP